MCTYKRFCCCCCNVVTCAKIIAILGLIAGVFNIVYALLGALGVGSLGYRYVRTFSNIGSISEIIRNVGLAVFLWGSVVATAIWTIPDALMLHGINRNRPGFMLPWLIMKMILLVIITIWSVVAIAMFALTIGVVNDVLRDNGLNQNDFKNLIGDSQNQDLENLFRNIQNLQSQGGTTVGLIILAVILAISNALGYYIWDIVKSAYKQIKEENRTNQHAYEMTARNTYEQKPPAYYAPA